MLTAALAALLLAFQAPRALGADDVASARERMKTCNTQAQQKNLEGGARNHFMRSCLDGRKGNGHHLSAHQRRSEACAQRARSRGLQGAERRGFMSECEKPPVKQALADGEKMASCERRAQDRRLDADETRKYLDGCASGLDAGERAARGAARLR